MRLALFALLVLPGIAAAQSPEIDTIVRGHMESSKTPGVTIAIVREGKVESKGYGMADVENRIPAKSETVYEIGSVTKQFTSTLVMMLVEQGKLKVDESILTYMPDLPEAWKGVTVRHLMNHTSGIRSFTSLPNFLMMRVRPAAPGDVVKSVMNEKMDFEPGAKWSYNNTGYYLLGLLIERTTKKTYRETLKEMILEPLGMRNTDMYGLQELVPHRSRGYQVARGVVVNSVFEDMSWPFSAGAILSTAPDLAKWAQAQGTDKLLKPDSWKEMWSESKLNDGKMAPYGFGWGFEKVPGSRVIEHGGAISGFQAQLSLYPDKKIAVIVLANCNSPMPTRLARDIAGALDPSLKIPAPKTIADDDPDLTKKLRGIFDDALKGKANPEAFAEDLRKELFPSRILMLKEQIAPLGAFTGFDLIGSTSAEGGKRRVYIATIGGQRLRVTFGVDAQGKIDGFLLQPTG